jgi:wobble nucleotide-excising tRNase
MPLILFISRKPADFHKLLDMPTIFFVFSSQVRLSKKVGEMLVKIKQIQGIDAFDQVRWTGEDLKVHNLIYGWNGSGKTTIAKILGFLEKKRISLLEYKSVEFAIQTTTGMLRASELGSHNLDMRVFDEDFVKENLLFDDSTAKQIVMIGKENLDLQKEIISLEGEKNEAQKDLDGVQAKCPKATRHLQILTDAASAVPIEFGNTRFANDVYYGRNYKKPKVDSLLADGTITEQNVDSLVITNPEILEGKREIVKQEKGTANLPLTELRNRRNLFEAANALLKLNVRTEEIEELSADTELRDWTEIGYRLHKDRNLQTCQFCHNQILKERFEKLGRYFTSELKDTKNKIDDLIGLLKKLGDSEPTPNLDSGRLFPDIAKDYLKAKQAVETHGDHIRRATEELINKLEQKKDSLAYAREPLEGVPYPEAHVREFSGALEEIRALFAKHNERVTDGERIARDAAKSIELHIVASVLKAREYFLHKREYEKAESKKRDLFARIAELTKKIGSKRAMMKNTAIAAEKINIIAKEYFGEGQIYLEHNEPEGETKGYILKRRDKPAKYLSEGEKSALALIYFFIKLEEEGSEKSSCIVVIDDPVDSQDARFLFQTYGLLKRQLENVKQLIIFTHNYEFFNLLRDWLIGKRRVGDSQLYLISINNVRATRELVVENLPELLKRFKSEYQYLFSLLYLYANGKRDLEEPLVANIARKVLEYFAGFKWACKTEEEFTSTVLTRYVDRNVFEKGIGDFIVKFVNEYSHGQEFSRPISASMFEAKKIAENTLQFIKNVDKEHFGKLAKNCDEISA